MNQFIMGHFRSHFRLSFLVLIIWTIAAGPRLSAQSDTLEIIKITPHEENRTLQLDLRAFDKDGFNLFKTMPQVGKTDSFLSVVFSETGTVDYHRAKWQSRNLQAIDATGEAEISGSKKEAPLTVLFLLDLSGSMHSQPLEEAKAAMEAVLKKDFLQNADTRYAFFHDSVFATQPVTKYNFKARIGPVKAMLPNGTSFDTDLYRAVVEKTTELGELPGQKVLVLLTDGKNDVKRSNTNYYGNNPIYSLLSAQEVYDHVARYDSTLQIYPVGFGQGVDRHFLRELASATTNQDDASMYGELPSSITRMFEAVARRISGPNYSLTVSPNYLFGPEKITFRVTDTRNGANKIFATKDIVLGSSIKPLDLRNKQNQTQSSSFTVGLLIGLAILVLIFMVISFLIPILNNLSFKRKHIRPYHTVKQENRVMRDPLTHDEYEDHDMVVINEKGDKMMSLQSWKYYNATEARRGHVAEYAELFQLQTKAGNMFASSFNFPKMRWLWFGAFGGFLAWLFQAYLTSFDLSSYTDFIVGVLDKDQDYSIANSVVNQTKVGVCLGVGIIGALATVEEMGQSRKFNLGRILIRVLIGMVLSYLIFFVESTLIAKFIPIKYIGELVSWMIFGTMMGLVVSLFSSIELMGGILGGALASVVAFHVYFAIRTFLPESFPADLILVISYVCYGAILGYTLFAVVSHLSSYELQCLAPAKFSAWVSPLSKWLKDSNIDYILIGSHPKNRVYIKWSYQDNSIMEHHARLYSERGKVYIDPQDGDVQVEGRWITGPAALRNGNDIVLGKNNFTRLRFVSKTEEEEASGNITINKPGAKKVTRSAQETAKIRNQITITRK
ncbi:VWA domain-containing protein [Lewinella sp. W8]|uniref:VWA domain-containing protein n=1 Tax=Lewinella sp. W8 TaxID=2528208 RepID=UPI001067EB91|nr:VWA domain-containing protein [Lewinella sp. W8]MTB52924.1 VWA domain-containing protein [Lewinella sp. W8]